MRVKEIIGRFYNNHFVKWKFAQSSFVIPFKKDGKMYLHVSQVCRDGTRVIRRTFLVEHLVDENLDVTDKTLEEEKIVFQNPALF